MAPFTKSVAFRTLIITFILLPLPLLLDSFIYLKSRFQENIRDAETFLINAGHTKVFVLSRFLQIKKGVFSLVEYFLRLKEEFPKEESETLKKKLQNIVANGNFKEILLLAKDDGSYQVVASSFTNSDGDPLTSNAFYENLVKASPSGNVDAMYSSSTKRHYFIFGKKIVTDKGKAVGIMLFVNDLSEELNATLQRSFHFNDYIYYALLNQNLEVVFAHDETMLNKLFFIPPVDKTKSFPLIQKEPIHVTFEEGFPFLSFMWDDIKMLGVVDPVPKTSFFLLTYTPKRQIFLLPLLQNVGIYLLYAIILVLGGMLATFLTARFAKPLKDLSQTMIGMRGGNLQLRYTPDRLGFEINFLGVTFNEMIQQLLDRRRIEEEEKIKTETYNEELRIAWEVQRSLLPEKMPDMEGVELTARYLPAKEVGGDFYDVFLRENGKELVLIGADGSGKGVGACFYSFCVRSYVRTFARAHLNLSSVVEDANRLFAIDSGDSGMFVTAACCIYDLATKKLTWTLCGHNPIFIWRSQDQVDSLEERAMPLGIDAEIRFFEKSVDLQKGDLVCIYTDGVTEAQNEKGEFFTEERLKAFLQSHGGEPVEKVAQDLIQEIKAFQGKAPQFDDITLLLMRVTA